MHDAGILRQATGMGDRSRTPNVFFTDVDPSSMTPEIARSIGIRSTKVVFAVEMGELQRAGIPVFQNPSHQNVFNAVTDWISSTFFR